MNRFDEQAEVAAIEYDPNRNARIALIEWRSSAPASRRQEAGLDQRGLSRASAKAGARPDAALGDMPEPNKTRRDQNYIIAPDGLKVGDNVLFSQKKIELKIGNRMPLEKIPVGTGVYNIELEPGQGAKLVRSAGALAIIQAVEGKYAQLKMPSGEIRLVKRLAQASIGQVSNLDHRLQRLGKAGRTRHRGRRPTVRGKAMNPVDHPYGGGEGRQPMGRRRPVTAWGKVVGGVKTRKKKKKSNKLIIKRRK